MRILVCLLALIAVAGASEERFLRNWDQAMALLKRNGVKDPGEGARQAAALLTAGGPEDDATAGVIASAFAGLLRANGAIVRTDPLGEREYGSHAQVVYRLLVFERGIAFARLVLAKTKEDATVVVAFAAAVDPVAVLPDELLAPDAR